MGKVYIGIDPGSRGGLAAIHSSGHAFGVRVNTAKAGEFWRAVYEAEWDMAAHVKSAPALSRIEDPYVVTAAIEKVTGSRGRGFAEAGMFRFGVSMGVPLGAAAAVEWSILQPTPSKWQRIVPAKTIGLKRGAREAVYLEEARKRWPGVPMRHKADAGIAAALWLAEWARKEVGHEDDQGG